MAVIYEPDPYCLEINGICKYEFPIREVFRKLSSDRETDIQIDRIFRARRFAGAPKYTCNALPKIGIRFHLYSRHIQERRKKRDDVNHYKCVPC